MDDLGVPPFQEISKFGAFKHSVASDPPSSFWSTRFWLLVPSRWPQCFTAVPYVKGVFFKKNEDDPNGKIWDYMGLYGIMLVPNGKSITWCVFQQVFLGVSEVSNKFRNSKLWDDPPLENRYRLG